MKHRSNDLKATTDAPIRPLIRPFQEFAARETSGGILLLLCTVAALVWVNSPWAGSYEALWHTKLILGLADHTLDHELHFWVNDGLMAIFFFVVGLEIKRELLVGNSLSHAKQRCPSWGHWVASRAGPDLHGSNSGGEGAAGWGHPMATDIAFVIGYGAPGRSRAPGP